MRRIFRPVDIAPEVAEVFRYDYRPALEAAMLRGAGGVYRSRGVPVELSQKVPRDTVLVAGWDLGQGNVLVRGAKIGECITFLYGGHRIVAYTLVEHGLSSLYVCEADISTFDADGVNALDSMEVRFASRRGSNCCLGHDGDTLFWRRYEDPSDGSFYVECRYDVESCLYEEMESVPLGAGTEPEFPEGLLQYLLRPAGRVPVLVLPPSVPVAGSVPAVVVCPGGPASRVPDARNLPELWQRMRAAGWYVVYPLRRGVRGLGEEWENGLVGLYGRADVDDIMEGARVAINSGLHAIDERRVGLYGASYGGYTAMCMAGRAQCRSLFKAVCTHCGVYNLAEYPFHSSGKPDDIMRSFAPAVGRAAYRDSVRAINPACTVEEFSLPMLLVHTLDDATCWFGQSVQAYNDLLRAGHAEAELLLAPGGHSYDIPAAAVVNDSIIGFFSSYLR